MFTINQKLWFLDTASNKKNPKIYRGHVIFENKYYMTLKSKVSKEAFLIKDFMTGRYENL